MEPILYKATHGARVGFDSQAIMAHNLANVNTPGFKAELFQAEKIHSDNAHPSSPSVRDSNGVDFTPGPIVTTGRDLDIAITGDGWLAVRDSNGKEAYTRGGNLQLDENGQLLTGSGRPVLGDGGPISIPPAEQIEIARDGTITIVPLGGKPGELAILDRLKLVSIHKTALMKNQDGLMQLKPGQKPDLTKEVSLLSGSLESSNVNAVDQMVRMITFGREFEGHMKIMESVDENTTRLAQLLRDD